MLQLRGWTNRPEMVDTAPHFVELVRTPCPATCLKLSEMIVGKQRKHDGETAAVRAVGVKRSLRTGSWSTRVRLLAMISILTWASRMATGFGRGAASGTSGVREPPTWRSAALVIKIVSPDDDV